MPILKATLNDVSELNTLVNSAYRGEGSKMGWTTEADILDGIRIDEPTLQSYLESTEVTILKYVDESGKIIGTVYLEEKEDKLYLGMFSVSPALQNLGIGKALMEEAERIAKAKSKTMMSITVIEGRNELIAWYERRGYAFTGETKPFDGPELFGIPRKPLTFIGMEKPID